MKRPKFPLVLQVLFVLAFAGPALGPPARGDVFVSNWNTGTVGQYSNVGASINPALITGMGDPSAIAVTGSNVLVVDYAAGRLGQYVLSGTPGSLSGSYPTLLTGLTQPRAVIASGSTFYVSSFSNSSNGKVGKYTLGATPGTIGSSNADFITGLTGGPNGVVVTGSRLFVENINSGVIGEYDAATGAVVNAVLLTVPNSQCVVLSDTHMFVSSYSGGNFNIGKYELGTTPGTLGAFNSSFISGTGGPVAMAIAGDDLYLTSYASNRISRYSTNGTLINLNMVTGLGGSVGLAATPEPASLALLGLGVAGLLLRRREERS